MTNVKQAPLPVGVPAPRQPQPAPQAPQPAPQPQPVRMPSAPSQPGATSKPLL